MPEIAKTKLKKGVTVDLLGYPGRYDALYLKRIQNCDVSVEDEREVMELLPALPDDVMYLIAGDGDDLQRLKQKARTLNLDDRVIFAGSVPEEEKAALTAHRIARKGVGPDKVDAREREHLEQILTPNPSEQKP